MSRSGIDGKLRTIGFHHGFCQRQAQPGAFAAPVLGAFGLAALKRVDLPEWLQCLFDLGFGLMPIPVSRTRITTSPLNS
jgi:hypothetical protein